MHIFRCSIRPFFMRICSCQPLAYLVISLFLFNCSSQRVVFEFSPDKVDYRRASSVVAKGAEIPAASATAAAPIAWESTAAIATVASPLSKTTLPRHAKSAVSRPRQVALPVALLGARKATRPGDFNPSEFLSQPSVERGSLIGGASIGALGVFANYAAVTSSSRTLLLTTGHYLLWISAALLLAWFVMKLLKARKE